MGRGQSGTGVPALILGVWAAWAIVLLAQGEGANVWQWLGLAEFDYDRSAKFGDSFGSLSAFMASLAAAGAWYAVGQTRRQAFEATFYSLIHQLNQIVEGTDIQGKRTVKDTSGKNRKENTERYVGKDAFSRLLRNLRLTVAGTKSATEEERVVSGYRKFHDKYQNDLAHYFRTLYHIVRYVEKASIPDKQLYMNILRAQMSDAEQTLMMYNCSVGKGRQKFKTMVENYSLLHNVSTHQNINHWEMTVLRPSFSASAFRDSDIEVWPMATDIRADIVTNQPR